MNDIGIQEKESRRLELERFKREIDLRQFATSVGYAQVQSSGLYWRGRRADKDEIVVTRKPDGVWVYANPRDVSKPKGKLCPGERPGDQGTVIDLLQRERADLARNIGEVRKELRRWTGEWRPLQAWQPLGLPNRLDRRQILATVLDADFQGRSAYLSSRGLRPETLSDPRLARTFGVRPWGEVIFPHRDERGITGFERKSDRLTGFSTGGTRAVWHSAIGSADRRLVVAESAIDCMSFHQLHPRQDARYMSTAGTISGAQAALLGKAIAKMPSDAAVVIATDKDDAGRNLARQIAAVAAEHNPSAAVEFPIPPVGKDWNDAVKQQERAFIQALGPQPGRRHR